MQRRVIRPIIASLLALWILHETALLGDEKPKEAAKADAAQIQKLIRQLGDDDFKKREEASRKLAGIGAPALQFLRQACQDPDREIGLRAQACKQKIYASKAVPVLIEMLCDPDQTLSLAALRGLGKKGSEGVPALIQALREERKEIRLGACLALGFIGANAKSAVAVLIEALDDNDKDVRERAAVALALIGPDLSKGASKLVPGLIKKLGAPEGTTRSIAVEILERIGPEVIPPVLDVRHSENKEVRANAIALLARFKDQVQKTLPIVLEGADDEDDDVRIRAASALCYVYKAKATVPKLVEILKDPKSTKRLQYIVARGLGNFGAEAEPAIPVLLECLRDKSKDKSVRMGAAESLGRIGPRTDEVIPALTTALKNKEDWLVRPDAAAALGTIGLKAKAAIPELIKALDEEEEKDPRYAGNLRNAALRALGQFGPEAKEAVPAILKLLNDKKHDKRAQGNLIAALGRIGPSAKAAVPELVRIVKENKEVQDAPTHSLLRISLWTLGEIGADARDALPVLGEIIEDQRNPMDLKNLAGAAKAGILRKRREIQKK